MKLTKQKLKEMIKEELLKEYMDLSNPIKEARKLTEAKKPVSFKLGGVTFGKDYQGLKSRNGGIRYYYQKGTGSKNMESDFGKFIVKVGGLVSSSDKNKVAKKLKEEKLAEKAKRDYKDEYKKFQSSTKSKKYRAELNKYNRQKGTYGNGDKKDASHRNGKIVGFEEQSKNRGRAEKSRLKKEGKLNEFNKKHFLNLIKQEIESLKGQIAYCKDGLRQPDLKKWIKKELEAVLKDKIKDLRATGKHYKRVQNLKEGKLTEKQLKGLNGIDDKTPLTKISYQQKLKIIQGTGNNISFKVPKGLSRNFWQVFSKGKIKSGKNGEGNKVYFLPGKVIDSPQYSSEKELVNNVLWDKMEEIRRFNESVNIGRREKSRLKKEGKLTEGKYLAYWNMKKHEINAKDLNTATIQAIKKLKIKKSNVDDLVVVLKSDHEKRVAKMFKDYDKIAKESKLTEGGKEIAKTILQQLGGNKFIAMTGAKNLGFTDKGIQFKIGRNAKGVTHVIIDLDRGKDSYDIEFVKFRGAKRTTIKKLKGIYADQLGKIFTQYTGLHIRL